MRTPSEAYREVLKRDPQRPGAWFGLAKIYQQQGKYEEALEAVGRNAEGGARKRQGTLFAGAVVAKAGPEGRGAGGVCDGEEIDGCGSG